MKTHAELIPDLKTAHLVKEATGAPLHTVRSWGQRGSIPAQYWQSIAKAGLASLDDLAATAPARKQAAA